MVFLHDIGVGRHDLTPQINHAYHAILSDGMISSQIQEINTQYQENDKTTRCGFFEMVAEVAVIGIPDEKYGEALMAFVVRMPGEELVESEVIDYATSKITPYKAPSKVKFVDTLPKSLVGKILKKELRKMV